MKKFSKHDAEMALNDMPRHQLPIQFQTIMEESDAYWLVAAHRKRKAPPKAGEIIRTNHRALFDKWFNETYP